MFDDLIRFVRNWYETDEFITLHSPQFGETDRKFVLDAIDSTFVSSVGEYVDRFEGDLATYLGAKRAVATVNGTAALQVALRLTGVGSDDEVVTQALTFVGTVNSIVYLGAHPVFVDVDRDTMGLCPESLESFLVRFAECRDDAVYNRSSDRRIAAIVPMHTFGHPCRMNEIMDVASKWELPVVEDAAEALGSVYHGKYCATIGKLGILSFNGNKTITCGGGGAIITNDEKLADRAKHLTTTAKLNHPWEYVHDEVGYNFRMPNLNAALACAQLGQLNAFLTDKRKLAKAYETHLYNQDWGTFFSEPTNCRSNYWLNAVVLTNSNQRDSLLEISNKAGVMTRPIWRLMSDSDMFRHCQTDSLENSKWFQDRVVNLPSSSRLQK